MKTYTFFFYNSLDSFKCDRKKTFLYSSTRFPVAFDAFLNFVKSSDFEFLTFVNYYSVASRHKPQQFRVFSSACYKALDDLRKWCDD